MMRRVTILAIAISLVGCVMVYKSVGTRIKADRDLSAKVEDNKEVSKDVPNK